MYMYTYIYIYIYTYTHIRAYMIHLHTYQAHLDDSNLAPTPRSQARLGNLFLVW